MGLATAEATLERSQPSAFWENCCAWLNARSSEVGLPGTQPYAPARLKILEGEVLQIIQVADRKQALVDLLGDLTMAAGANLQPAKIRMTDRAGHGAGIPTRGNRGN